MKNIENTKIDYLNIGKFVGKTRSGKRLWECRCECGNEFIVDELYLNKKKFHSCSKCGYIQRTKRVVCTLHDHRSDCCDGKLQAHWKTHHKQSAGKFP